MTSKNKARGNTFERKLVNMAKEFDLPAKRAYASQGTSLGETEETDLVVFGMRIQAKKRKKLTGEVPKWIHTYLDSCKTDALVVGVDRHEPVAILSYKHLLTLISLSKIGIEVSVATGALNE